MRNLYFALVLVALLCLAGWTTHAQLQRNTQTRETWEYMEVELEARFQANPRLNQYGAQGWELVSVVSGCPSAPSVAQSCRYWAYLKRAK